MPATHANGTPTTTTRSAVITAFGDAELLHPRETPLAGPVAGQVQVKVAAAAVNPVDLSTRAGKSIPADSARFPMVLGWDAAGTITAVGAGVSEWQVGDRVAAMTFQPIDQNGTYTQHLDLAADLVARVPDDLELTRAATIPLAGLTASQLLQWADLPAGSTLLVNGPLGAVGRLAVQLAARSGIRVVAVAKPEDRALAIDLGSAQVVDRGEFTSAVRTLHPRGVDAAIDLVGGAAARSALASVEDGGAYITAVPQYIDPAGPFETERGIRFAVHTVQPDTPVLTGLLEAAARGELSTTVEASYPLAEAAQAHHRQARGGLRGKVVLIP